MKHSIKKRMMSVFVGLVILVMVAFLMINGGFLERYYIANKKIEFEKVYDLIEKDLNDEHPYLEYKNAEVNKMAEKNNILFLVVDQQYNPVFTNAKNLDVLVNQLWGYLFNKNINLDSKENYNIGKSMDLTNNTEYIEMWGKFDNNDLFIMRSPLESIRDSIRVFNKFIGVVGVSVMLLSIALASYFSKRITEPIRELADISQKMTELDFNAKYTSGGDDEIGILGQNFNRMADKLEQTISDLKKANNELMKDIEQKEQIEQMRMEFLGNVSHELKTPIALIQGYAEGLKEGVNDDSESREFYCDVIIDEASKMNQMVKNLMTLNQLESGEENVEFTRFDISALIQGVLQSLEILINQRQADVHFSGGTPVFVWGDEWKVEQVVRNYVNNALNHVSGDMVIDIRIAKSEEKVTVSVFNTGQPIPEEDVSHLWEKFYKVDKARTREYGGNGIGLSIVKAIMESLHQGYGVKNYDNGVEFWFELDRK